MPSGTIPCDLSWRDDPWEKIGTTVAKEVDVPPGKRKKYADELVTRIRREYNDWIRHIPQCPPTEENILDRRIAGRFVWCEDNWPDGHEPLKCYRSMLGTGSGQQCCYWNDHLVLIHKSRGSADKVGIASGRGADGQCTTDYLSGAWATHLKVDSTTFTSSDGHSIPYELPRPAGRGYEENVIERVAAPRGIDTPDR